MRRQSRVGALLWAGCSDPREQKALEPVTGHLACPGPVPHTCWLSAFLIKLVKWVCMHF